MAKKLTSRLTGFMRLRGSIYHAEKMIRGVRVTWSTQSGDIEAARRRAADHWQKVIAGEFQLVDAQKAQRTCSTVGELIVAYLAMLYPSAGVRRANVSKLRRILAVALNVSTRAVDGMGLHVLTEKVVRSYQAAVLAEADEEEPELIERARYSANSMLTQARSVLKSMQALEQAGIVWPGDKLVGFREAEKFQGVKIDTEFMPFREAEFVALRAALERARQDNPPVWLGAALMLWCGLRNSEVLRAAASALRQESGAWFLKVGGAVKAEGSMRSVPVPVWLAAELRAQAGVEEAGAKLWAPRLAASERARVMTRELSTWVQRVLPAEGSPSGEARGAYDLRRQAGSLVMDAQGLEAARDFLGHRTSETTRRWYASRIRALKPIGELVGV